MLLAGVALGSATPMYPIVGKLGNPSALGAEDCGFESRLSDVGYGRTVIASGCEPEVRGFDSH